MKIYQNTIIVSVVAIVSIWFIVQFGFVPRFKKIKTYQKSLVENMERNKRIQSLVENEDFFADLLKKIAIRQDDVKQSLPKKLKVSGLLRELSFLAKKHTITVLSMKPIEVIEKSEGEEKEEEGELDFKKVDVEIIAECTYSNLGEYIESIESNDLTIMAIKKMDMSIGKKEAEEQSAQQPDTIILVAVVIEANYK